MCAPNQRPPSVVDSTRAPQSIRRQPPRPRRARPLPNPATVSSRSRSLPSTGMRILLVRKEPCCILVRPSNPCLAGHVQRNPPSPHPATKIPPIIRHGRPHRLHAHPFLQLWMALQQPPRHHRPWAYNPVMNTEVSAHAVRVLREQGRPKNTCRLLGPSPPDTVASPSAVQRSMALPSCSPQHYQIDRKLIPGRTDVGFLRHRFPHKPLPPASSFHCRPPCRGPPYFSLPCPTGPPMRQQRVALPLALRGAPTPWPTP